MPNRLTNTLVLLLLTLLSACNTASKPKAIQVFELSGDQEVISDQIFIQLVEIQIEGTLSKDGQDVDAYYLLGDTISQVPEKSILDINGHTALPPYNRSFPPDYSEYHTYIFNAALAADREPQSVSFQLKPEYTTYEGQLHITIKDISEGNPR